MSIATEISRLQSAKADIKTAIEGKGVTVPSSATLDEYDTYIGQISGGGSSGLPDWMKDGDTHLWIEILNSYQLSQQIRIRMIGTIDWGDGTTTSANVTTYTTFSHTYSAPGKYRIDLHPTSGTFYLGGASSSYNVMGTRANRHDCTYALYQAEVGSSIINTLSTYTFYACAGLLRVYIPANITTISAYAFEYCRALREIEFADVTKVTSVSGNLLFGYCNSLQSTSGLIPAAATLTQTYRECSCLHEVTIPSNVTTLSTYALYYCYCLRKIKCLPTTPPTVSNANTFSSLPSFCVIEVPKNKLSEYQSATNWSTYASQMVEASS